MSTIRFLAIAGLLFGVAAAQAQTVSNNGAAQPPLTQGTTSVDKNLKRDPDNKGLQNADQRLQTNQNRLEARKAKVETRVDTAKAQRMERPDRPERAGRAGR